VSDYRYVNDTLSAWHWDLRRGNATIISPRTHNAVFARAFRTLEIYGQDFLDEER
jgi:hypothetical protein